MFHPKPDKHEFTRRSFLKAGASFGAMAMFGAGSGSAQQPAERPNVLWLVSEDNSPWLGCYGVEGARTPNLDALAAQGVRFDNACANGAVCAPCRHTIITGMYATCDNAQHMRTYAKFAEGVPLFPAWLRRAGYYTTNNSKTDYNGAPTMASLPEELHEGWDESSNKAHWRKRPEGKPFFSVFNFGQTHESRLFPRKWGDRELKSDPAIVDLPSYLPDDPVVREDLARYYDRHEQMDAACGRMIQQLKDDGLYEDTIIFYYGDHGGSMPRGKSYIYESGTRVPMIVRVPEKFRRLCPWEPGSNTDEMVGFIDLAPTMLSLAGVQVPDYMQGQAFLGRQRVAPPERRKYNHTFRGRRGDGYDICRGVRDKRYKYIRNYTPHVPVMQYNAYSWQIRSYGVWHDHYQGGELEPHQARWFEAPKPYEELYDLQEDPHELHNLAGDAAHEEKLQKLREAMDEQLRRTVDSGFHPEGMGPRRWEERQDPEAYPLEELMELAATAGRMDPENLPRLQKAMSHADAGMRWWAAMGCVYLQDAARPAVDDLLALLKDESGHVQAAAAEALCHCGRAYEAVPIIDRLLGDSNDWVQLHTMLALRHVIDEIDETVIDMGHVKQQVIAATESNNNYVRRVAEHMVETRGWREA
jgi:arylsulfatase A-like enzyme